MSEKTYLLVLSVVLGSLGAAAWKMRTSAPAVTQPTPPSVVPPPSTLAKWPFAGATPHVGAQGVVHYSASKGGTIDIDFVEFDFKANPKLQLELFDHEQQGSLYKAALPATRYNAAALLFRQSDARGQVLAVCNGGPFIDTVQTDHHFAPIVNQGQVHLVAERQPLWTLGVRKSGTPRFELVWQASKSDLNRFLYATGGVQCLVKDGVSLNINEPTAISDFDQSHADTMADVGNKGPDDWIKTSRLSLAWNRDGSKLWMLSVHVAMDEELAHKTLNARLQGQGAVGYTQTGWTARDVQDFWKSQGAANAVLLASGDYAQFASRLPNGNISFVPSIVRSPGTLMRTANGGWSSGGWAMTTGIGVVGVPSPGSPVIRERPTGYSRLVGFPKSMGTTWGVGALFYWMVRETK